MELEKVKGRVTSNGMASMAGMIIWALCMGKKQGEGEKCNRDL